MAVFLIELGKTMTEFLKSQLITSIALALFYSIYALFLKKETFFKANRYVLLAILALSFAAPFVKISTNNNQVELIQSNEIVRTTRYALVEPTNKMTTTPAPVANKQATVKSAEFNTENIWNYLYLLGLIGFGFKFLHSLFGVYKVHRKSVYNSNGYYEISEEISSFSFFKSIYLSACLSDAERSAILIHEKVHVNQKHTIDTMLFAIAKCLQWYNPFMYLLDREVKEVHEYLADEITSEQSKIEYMELLLNQTLSAQLVDLGNNFNSSTILKRLKMLDKSKSSKIKALKYAMALLPVVLCMVLFSCGKEDFSPKITLSFAPIQKNYANDAFLIDKMQEPIMGWKAYNQLIDEELKNPQVAIKNGIAGLVRIGFTLDSTGKMINLEYVRTETPNDKSTDKGIGYGIEEEAIRVVKKLAENVKWKPAMYKGRGVNYDGLIELAIGDPSKIELFRSSTKYIQYHKLSGELLGYYTNIGNSFACRTTAEPALFNESHFKFIDSSLNNMQDLFSKKDSGEVLISYLIDGNGKSTGIRTESKINNRFEAAIKSVVENLHDMKSAAYYKTNERFYLTVRYKSGVIDKINNSLVVPGYILKQSSDVSMPQGMN